MKLKHTHLFRKAARASFLLAAVFLAGVGPARAFVTDNESVTTFYRGKNVKKVPEITVTVNYVMEGKGTPPTAYAKNASNNPGSYNLITSGNVADDPTFLAFQRDIASGKSWELAIQYMGTDAINSLTSVTFAVGTLIGVSGSGGNWYTGNIGTNVVFTATINTTVGGTIDSTGHFVEGTGTHENLGTLEGYLFDKDSTSDEWIGTGSDKQAVTLNITENKTRGDGFIDLSPYTNYCIHITAQFYAPTGETSSPVSNLNIGMGSIVYQGETTVAGYLWRGTGDAYSWDTTSSIWSSVDENEQETPNQKFEYGGNALFDGLGNPLVRLDQTMMAANVIIQGAQYTFDMVEGVENPLSSTTIILDDEDAGMTLQGNGTVVTGTLAGEGTLAKAGNNTSTLKVTNGAQQFTGNIKVRDGVLDIQSATALSIEDLILENGGQLEVGQQIMEVNGTLKGGGEGTGASAGNITLAPGATLDASDAEGQGGINLTGSVTLNYGVKLSQNDFDIFFPGTKPGDEYDLLTVTGDLKLMNEAGQIINATELGENYDAANLFPNFTEGYFALRYDVAPGSNVGRFYLYTVVPEPATCTLSLLALAALAARRRRKNGAC